MISPIGLTRETSLSLLSGYPNGRRDYFCMKRDEEAFWSLINEGLSEDGLAKP